MSVYDPSVPLNSDSPSVFPAQSQANFSRLQTLLGADHQFNLSAVADDGYHNLIRMTQQAPTGALAATGRLYAKVANGQVNLFYMDDAGTDYQITPAYTVLAGTVNIVASNTFYTITAVPANTFGEVFLWKGRFIQQGTFISDATIVNGYSFAEKYEDGSGASQILNLGFDGAGANLLNLTVKNTSGSSFNGVWNYKVFYRTTA